MKLTTYTRNAILGMVVQDDTWNPETDEEAEKGPPKALIASYSYARVKKQSGIGPRVLMEIIAWLAEDGFELRDTPYPHRRTNMKQSALDQQILWGEFKATKYEGPVDMSNWDFGDDTPWLVCDDEFQVVVPNWAVVEGRMECVQVGISFIAMINRYKEIFLTENVRIGEKEMVVETMKKAIAILEAP